MRECLHCWAISLSPAFIVFQRDFTISLMLALHFPVELRSTFKSEDSARVTILWHSGFGGQNCKHHVCPCQRCLLMSYLLLLFSTVTLTAHSGPPHLWKLGPAHPVLRLWSMVNITTGSVFTVPTSLKTLAGGTFCPAFPSCFITFGLKVFIVKQI